MMPSSYRQPDERREDRVVYFDYAKSLESGRRPIPWKPILRQTALTMIATALVGGISFLISGQVTSGLLLRLLVPLLLVPGVAYVTRQQRALSGDNFSSSKRGRGP